MAITIRIFGRWTARADNGVWCVLEGPRDVAYALNAIAEDPPASLSVDEHRLCEARRLYGDLEELPSPTVGCPTIR